MSILDLYVRGYKQLQSAIEQNREQEWVSGIHQELEILVEKLDREQIETVKARGIYLYA